MGRGKALALVAALALSVSGPTMAAQGAAPLTLEEALGYPFVTGIVSAREAPAIAWVRVLRGRRNIWTAAGPAFRPRQLTAYADDDGQELSWLGFTPDGRRLVYARGGDHDANWPVEGRLAPDPTSSPEEPKVAVWSIAAAGGAPVRLDDGDAPVVSARGQVAYVKDGVVWSTEADGSGKPEKLFFDRGKDGELAWSPDGSHLAFVSRRGDHAFIGVYSGKAAPIVWLAPSTGRDAEPAWSADGKRIAFTRRRGLGGPPLPLLTDSPNPWSIWVAEADGSGAHEAWKSPETLAGSYPEGDGGANLAWTAGDQLAFLAESDNWPHLYAAPAAGGPARLLTPGAFMVEHIRLTRDRKTLIYDANTGGRPGDDDRRHLFAVAVAGGAPVALTPGDGLEWKAADAGDGQVAFVSAGGARPAQVERVSLAAPHAVAPIEASPDFPTGKFVAPQKVTWSAPDGTLIHGQLFARQGGGAPGPGVIFVHGGPMRQMLLGWHYMDYYANAYAVNEALAAAGFTVLSVNYRLGIGYGHAFHYPEHAGPAGAAEYQDVLSGARFLQKVEGVDPARIGIWGGSYGGYLTALGLARNSDLFKAGVDMHGIHDWTQDVAHWIGQPPIRFEQGDREAFMKTAWAASPDADMARWTSPVMLIQGDDDRNVEFHQMVDVVRRLEARGTPFEQLVLPDEIHGFLRYASWLAADRATVDFLIRKLASPQ